MNTKHLSWMLATLLIAVLSINITACKEDDKELTPEEQDQQATAQNLIDMTFWGVAGQLANGCEQVDDWQSARLEANIGQPSQQSDATRIVLVNDADAALERFSALIGTQLPDYTVSYEWTLDGAGSLTYRKQTDGTAWATVDVDLKQFPGLKRIVYCAPEQQGLNGDFKGTAYYRFGDVIKKKNSDGNWDYWICVRPCFGKEGKQDMHWVTLSDFPKKYIKEYTASTGATYYMPTKLSGAYSSIHWQNAAEMLFAILHPQKWLDNFNKSSNKKLPFFNDFSKSRIGYHNQYFWMRVQKGWEKHGLFNELLHFDYNTLSNDMQSIRFIYYGYKWKWTFSWDMTLWAQEYSGMDNNFHTFKALEKTENVKDKPFNVHDYGKFGEHGEGYQPFPRFTYPCRYATGKELAGFTPNEYSTIANEKNGIVEVYRYNEEYNITASPGNEPEECTEDMVNGGNVDNLEYGFFTPGTIISDSAGVRWLCYLSWLNAPDLGAGGVGGGHKARFISFDGIKEKGNSVKSNSSANYGYFAVDLIPEKEVPILAYLLHDYAYDGTGPKYELYESVKTHMGVDLQSLFIRRDTLFNSGKTEGQAHIDATNFLYEPAKSSSDKYSSQPYMRYVMDGTHVGNNRGDLPQAQQYWMNRFFKKVSDPEDQRPLDLVYLYKWYKLFGDETIKADQWSRCKHHNTDYRDHDFTAADCYDSDYKWRDFRYDTKNAQWLETITENGFTRPKYVSAYWEPVVIVRYMELEDTNQKFQKTYNNQEFTLIREPDEYGKILLRTTIWTTLDTTIGNTWMDYIPYNMVNEIK